MTTLVPAKPRRLSAKLKAKLQNALLASLDNCTEHTRRSYRRGLVVFGMWLGHPDQGVLDLGEPPELRTAERRAWEEEAVSQAGRYLISLPSHEATLLGDAFIRDLLYGESPSTRSTVTSRLAALQWAVTEARRLGHITWQLQTKMPPFSKTSGGLSKEKEGRDMTGPTLAQSKKLLAAAEVDPDPRSAVLMSMLRYEGYREHEIRQLDLKDLNLEKGWVRMVRKKRSKVEQYPLSEPTQKAMKRWLRTRGQAQGALFYGGIHGGERKTRIGESVIWTIVRRVGKEARVVTSPHRIRHRACTDIVRVGKARGLPEEDLLFLTGHAALSSLQPYYEATKSRKAARAVLDAVFLIEDEDEVPS